MAINQQEAVGTPKMRVAFLGGGVDSAVGRVHQVAISMDLRFELVAGCFSRKPDINSETGWAYGVAPERVYGTLDDLISGEDGVLDAIVILTPTDQHKDQVVTCIKAGIPVISEKALATSSADAREIRGVLSHEKGFLSVTYNYLGYPMLRELQNLVQLGKLGKIQQVHVEMPQEGFAKVSGEQELPITPQPWRLHDNRVPTLSLDLGVHLHIITKFLTGETPLEVVALCNTFGHFDQVVDNVIGMAKYTNNMVSNIWYGKTALGYRNGLKVRILGERGSAEWYQENPEQLLLCDRHGRRSNLDRAHPDILVANQARYTRFKAGHPAGFIEAFANIYCDIADELFNFRRNCIASNNAYVFGVEEALEGLDLFEAISQSAKHNVWVKVCP